MPYSENQIYSNRWPDVRAEAGQAIATGEIVSISSSDGLAYLASAGAGIEELPAIGVAEVTVAIGEMLSIKRLGLVSDASNLLPGGPVFVSDTPGEINVVAGATSNIVGVAFADDQWSIDPETLTVQQTQH